VPSLRRDSGSARSGEHLTGLGPLGRGFGAPTDSDNGLGVKLDARFKTGLLGASELLKVDLETHELYSRRRGICTCGGARRQTIALRAPASTFATFFIWGRCVRASALLYSNVSTARQKLYVIAVCCLWVLLH
jgi:hypothetical protein